MKKIIFTQCFMVIFAIAFAQTGNTWIQKTDVGGTARSSSVGFSIGDKGYIGTGNQGFTYFKDFWEYDPVANVWSQKSNFGGVARNLATGFSIGFKGYIGTGSDGVQNLADFWEYDPIANTWVRKADVPSARFDATAFAIGNKGYLGMGQMYKAGVYTSFADCWEYDPVQDTWTGKADFGGGPRNAQSSFVIGSKGYVGIGYNNGDYKDFWEYDPAIDVWTRKADVGGVVRRHAAGFAIGNKGYIGFGDNDYGQFNNDMWEYDPVTDKWIEAATFPGGERSVLVGFAIGSKGYVGTGYRGVYYKDFWEYTPDNAVTGSPTVTSFTPASGPVGISITITGTNFGASPADNIVYFGATKATVTAASTTALTVIAPGGATYEPITVTTSGLTAYAAAPFLETFNGSGDPYTAGSFAARVDFATGIQPCDDYLSDLDGDGKTDIIAVDYNSRVLLVYRNTCTSGNISFASKQTFVTNGNPGHIYVGDIDGDGKVDVISANSSPYTVSVFRNTSTSGNISFDTKKDFATGTNPGFGAIADIDGDGKPDIITPNNGSNSFSVLRNTSTIGNVSFENKIDFATGATGGNPYSLAIGDLDGDGKPDVAVAYRGTVKYISVFRNTSSEGVISFESKVDCTTGADEPNGVSIGDLDNDGKSDLIVANFGDNFAPGYISIFRNKSTAGTLSFDAKVNYPTGAAGADRISINDLNGDGKLDITCNNYWSNVISVFRNMSTIGTISFDQSVLYATNNGPTHPVTGDLDGDGKNDIAIANVFSGQISVFRNLIPSVNVPLITAVTNINSSQAYVHWRPYADAASYMVRRYRAGTTDYDNYLPVTDTFRKINNMSANSLYITQVKAYLNNGDSSDWSAPYSFTTANTCAVPLDLRVSKISDTSARLGWLLPVLTATDFKIRYKESSQTEWSLKTKKGTETKYVLWKLKPATLYNWQIRSMCTDDVTEWVKGPDFTTAASFAAFSSDANNSNVNVAGKTALQITPNPNKGNFTLQMQLPAKATATTIELYNSLGQLVWLQNLGNISGTHQRSIALETKFSAGLYTLTIQRSDIKLNQKIIISK